jgi:hypothetical protein
LAEHVAGTGKSRGVYRVLAGKPEGKRPLGRPRHRWDSNIKMDFQEVGLGAWSGLMWLRIGKVVGTCYAPLSKQAISLQYQLPFNSFIWVELQEMVVHFSYILIKIHVLLNKINKS